MFDFQQKRRLRAIVNSPITIVCLLIIAFFVYHSAYNRYVIARDMADRRAQYEAEMATLEQRRAQLEEEVSYLSHERGIEAEMRRQFDIARSGEQVVIIIGEDTTTSTLPIAPATSTKPQRPWYRFW